MPHDFKMFYLQLKSWSKFNLNAHGFPRYNRKNLDFLPFLNGLYYSNKISGPTPCPLQHYVIYGRNLKRVYKPSSYGGRFVRWKSIFESSRYWRLSKVLSHKLKIKRAEKQNDLEVTMVRNTWMKIFKGFWGSLELFMGLLSVWIERLSKRQHVCYLMLIWRKCFGLKQSILQLHQQISNKIKCKIVRRNRNGRLVGSLMSLNLEFLEQNWWLMNIPKEQRIRQKGWEGNFHGIWAWYKTTKGCSVVNGKTPCLN